MPGGVSPRTSSGPSRLGEGSNQVPRSLLRAPGRCKLLSRSMFPSLRARGPGLRCDVRSLSGRGPRVGENKLRLAATCPSPGSRRLQGRSSRVAASPVHSHRYGPRCASRRPGAPGGLGLGIGCRGSPSASSSSLACQSPPPQVSLCGSGRRGLLRGTRRGWGVCCSLSSEGTKKVQTRLRL